MVMKDWDEALDDVDPSATLSVDEVLDNAEIDVDGLSVDDLMDLARDGDRRALERLQALRAQGAA